MSCSQRSKAKILISTSCINFLLLSTTSLSSKVAAFTPASGASAVKSRIMSSAATSASRANASSSFTALHAEKQKLSVAILGGGIAGLSCASQLLSQHKQIYDPSSSYELEVTVFDTGRLRPGGRCSSRLPGDKLPVVKNSPAKNNNNTNSSSKKNGPSAANNIYNNNGGQDNMVQVVPSNIQKALDENSNIANSMGPVDHAAQILSIPNVKGASFDDFEQQLQQWLKEGIVESFPEGSVCEMIADSDGDNANNAKDKNKESSSIKLEPLTGDMYYGKGGMGNIPIAMRDHCESFTAFGEEYTGQSFRILQDVWVSPSNGVKYIGSKDGAENDLTTSDPKWELRAGKKSLGKYHQLVIAHNGKCADRIMSRTPAKAFHSLLRTKFSPYVPQWGGKEMTLNSIYSLVFAVKAKNGGDSDARLSSPIAKAISELSSSNDDSVYTVMIKNEPTLRLLSCNTLKHHHNNMNPNSESNIEVYTLLSSPKFGKQFKGPQENLPTDLSQKVTMKMLTNLERSLNLQDGSVVDLVVDLKLQLWGAAVPMNTWQSSTSTTDNSKGGLDGFVYDGNYGVGACGDWIYDPSVAGAWESGRRLANWILDSQEKEGGGAATSVGLPDREKSSKKKFVPSRVALGSGIGTIPSNSPAYEFASNEQQQQQQSNRSRSGGTPRTRSAPSQNNKGARNAGNSDKRRGKNNGNRKGSVPAQPASR